MSMRTVSQLEDKLAEPSEALAKDVAKLDGDIMVLGVGGKVGPSLAQLARNAINQAGIDKRVIGVARFSDEALANELQDAGIETVAADLTDEHELQGLPEVENIIYMIGYKFGTTGNEHFAWAMNSFLPGRVAEKFKDSRIVAFSTLLVVPTHTRQARGRYGRAPHGANWRIRTVLCRP